MKKVLCLVLEILLCICTCGFWPLFWYLNEDCTLGDIFDKR